MPRWLRVLIIVIAGLIGLLGLIYLALYFYVQQNRDRIITEVKERAKERIRGELVIGGLDFALFRHPGEISIDLRNVRIRDSLWPIHQVTLFEAQALGLVFHPLDLIGDRKEFRSVYLQGAHLNLYSDSSGYSNLSAFTWKSKPEDSAKSSGASPMVFNFLVQDLHWTIVDLPKAKSFSGRFHQWQGTMHPRSWGWTLKTQLDLQIEDFAFNLAKGSFMEGERLRGTLEAHFHDEKKLLVLEDQILRLGVDPIEVSGYFRFKVPRDRFQLILESKRIDWQRATELVTQDIRRKLQQFSLRDPIPVQVAIDGRMKYLDTPKVDLQFKLLDNQLSTELVTLDHISLEGQFTNYVQPGMGHGDPNSRVSAFGISAQIKGVPFESDSVIVTHLQDPYLVMDARGQFPLVQMKELLPSHLFQLRKGDMAFQIRYEGPAAVDKGRPRWSGSMQVRNGEFTYIPRNLCFDLLQAKIRLDGVDLFVDELQANTGNSDIHMKGRTRGLLTYFYRNPRRVGFNWELNSPWIDLNDFHSFLAPRRYQMPFPVQGPPKGSFGDQLEQVLARSLAHLEVNVDSLTYRKFASRNISAKVILGDKHITVPDFNIEHAEGYIKAKVSLQENLTGTEFKLQGSIQHVDVKKLFYGFENFGQKAIEAESLEGIFSAGVHLKGRFSNTGNLQPGSMGGQVDFELREGALIEYEPLMKVGRFVFKNRNLEELRFKRISNQLDLKEGTITIHPMLIESSALYLKLYGVYGIHGGTDIHLEIPLRNPQKDEMRRRKGLPIPQKNKGIVLYLRVQDQPDGSISIGWDDERGEGKTDSLWAP